MGRPAQNRHHCAAVITAMECPMFQPNDLSWSLVPFEQDATLVAVIELRG
jgi:hypothetical protein